MTYDQIHHLFKQRYNSSNWKQFLGEAFVNTRLYSTPEILTGVDSNVASQVQKLGNILLNESGIERQIAVFEVALAPGIILERNRVGLRNLLRKYWKDIDAAFITYHNAEKGNWRFTYVSELTGYDAEGEFVKIKTEPKRYTYVLGEGESTRTAAERFTAIASKGFNATLDDVKEAFSVEKLSKAFFGEYKKHYDIFCDIMVSKPSIRQTIFNGDEKSIRDFNKKLLGRIVFLYFIQKKGWLGVPSKSDWGKGDCDFLTNLFNNTKNPDLFYSELLSKLFFDTLNTKRKDDLIELVKGEPCRIPYLNGGLFEEDDKKHRNLIFPANLFKSLFDFFNQYNFTIYEDDPNDHTVAVDPEMLGHIFENLLEDNKDKGAYYTPKEIVHYMCQESLIEYLSTWFENKGYEVVDYIGFDKPDQPKLFSANEGRKGQLLIEDKVSNSSNSIESGKLIDRTLIEKLLKKKLDDEDKKLILKHSNEFHTALDDVKICDPAIGSGAFPMGLLHEIFTAKQTLHTFEYGNTLKFDASTVKLNIIQNSIYGVDIEKGAVDIARLRFWLSLIVDEETPKPLPNLDYKIVVGNSLVSKLGEDIIDIDWTLNETSQGLFGSELALQKSELLKKISKEQKEFFNPDSDKKKLATDIRKLKIDLLITQLELMVKTKGIENQPTSGKSISKQTDLYLQTIGWKNSIKDLQKLKSKPELSLHFFDWKLDFPEVMNPVLFVNNSPSITVANLQIIAMNNQIDAINLHLSQNHIDTHLIHLQANIAQNQIAVINELLSIIEKKIKEIFGSLKNVENGIVNEPNQSIVYNINSINISIEDINHRIEAINPQLENQNPNIGFDIVIGNPPYVEAKKLKHISQFLKGYSVYSGTSDLSSYFFEQGLRLCKSSGLLCLINTNKFFNTGYGKPLRALIIQNEIKQLLNFEQVEVFEGILVSSVIIGIKKKSPSSINSFPFKKFFKMKNIEFMAKFVEDINNRDSYNQNDLTKAEWSFADSSNLLLKEKIENNAIKLIELKGVSIYRGITTGYNPAFIINDDQKEELIKEDIKNKNVIKSLLQGRNIRKWIYNESDENLLFVPWHFPLHNDDTINGNSAKAEKAFKNDYPKLYEHLSDFKVELSSRNKEETGIRYEWYALQRCAASYYTEFEKSEKIIWGLTADKWAYAYDDKQHYLPSNGYILTSYNTPIKYLLGLINSNLLKYYFGFIGVMTAGGAFTLKHATIQQLPIRVAKNQKIFSDLVDKVLSLKSEGKNTTSLEQEIDNIVYKLYELTYDEVKVIDPLFTLSEVEYDAIQLE